MRLTYCYRPNSRTSSAAGWPMTAGQNPRIYAAAAFRYRPNNSSAPRRFSILISVDPAKLAHPAAVARYAARERSYRSGIRFALEALGIPVPAPLQRRQPGRKRHSPT